MLHETVVIIYFFRQVIYMFFLKEISNKKCEGGGTSWASNSAPSCALVIRTLIWINLYWSQLFPSLSFCCLDRYPKWLELLFIAATWHFGIPPPAKLPRTLLSKLKTSHFGSGLLLLACNVHFCYYKQLLLSSKPLSFRWNLITGWVRIEIFLFAGIIIKWELLCILWHISSSASKTTWC